LNLSEKLSLKKHKLEKLVYDNVPHDCVSIMDVDALYTYYKTPGKPQIAVEYKNQYERLRPTQWFNLPRLTEDHGIPYCILRYLESGTIQFEHVDKQNYLNTIVVAVFSEEEALKILSNYQEFIKYLYFSGK